MARRSPNSRVFVGDISRDEGLPRAYLAKIFQKLCKKGILVSFKGVDGGFAFGRDPGEINLLEMIEAIEGAQQTATCLLRSCNCGDDGCCALHERWMVPQKKLLEFLGEYSFAELARDMKSA